MARTITYEGYTIQSTPHEIAGEKWRLHIRITGNDHRGVRSGPVWLDSMFHSLSGASRCSAYAAVRRAGRLLKYTPSGV